MESRQPQQTIELLLDGISNRENILMTCLHGFVRSRFILKSELILLARRRTESSFKKIIHICDKDQTLNRLYHETQCLPFKEFGVEVAKYYNNESELNKSDPPEAQHSAQLLFCTIKHVFNSDHQLDTSNSVIVFDGLTLESIEGHLSELQQQKYPSNAAGPEKFMPKFEFERLIANCFSILLACSFDTGDIERELGCKFSIRLTDATINMAKYRTFASILTSGHDTPFEFGTGDKSPKIYDEVGAVLEFGARKAKSGGIVVFFPSYGRMVEYHNAWKKSGLWERINLPYGRENRAGDNFKNGLIKLAQEEKSIFLASIRYHQDETLAEFALSLASTVIVVGLPYPFMNDSWQGRINHLAQSNNELLKLRALDFMSGIVKRSLNELRYRDCAFFLLDCKLDGYDKRIAAELPTVLTDSFDLIRAHYENFVQ